MIEVTIYNFLKSKLDCSVCTERPEVKPKKYVLLERIGGSESNFICSATIDIMSYGGSLYESMELDEKVRKFMSEITALDNVSSCVLNASGNWTNPTTREYRYHSTFIVKYMED